MLACNDKARPGPRHSAGGVGMYVKHLSSVHALNSVGCHCLLSTFRLIDIQQELLLRSCIVQKA